LFIGDRRHAKKKCFSTVDGPGDCFACFWYLEKDNILHSVAGSKKKNMIYASIRWVISAVKISRAYNIACATLGY
jgi:hypothetical protein